MKPITNENLELYRNQSVSPLAGHMILSQIKYSALFLAFGLMVKSLLKLVQRPRDQPLRLSLKFMQIEIYILDIYCNFLAF